MSLTRRKLFGIVVGGLVAPFLPKRKHYEATFWHDPVTGEGGPVGRDWVVKHSYVTSIVGVRPETLILDNPDADWPGRQFMEFPLRPANDIERDLMQTAQTLLAAEPDPIYTEIPL